MPSSLFGDSYEFECDVKGNYKLSISLRKNEKQLFVDLKELPVDEIYFKELAGYRSGYLLLQDDNSPLCRECCELATQLTARSLF
jgi:hypothetical protein